MKEFILLYALMSIHLMSGSAIINNNYHEPVPLVIKKCSDFGITGKGDNKEWERTMWNNLTQLDTAGKTYSSQFKILYSATGIYVLFNGEDERITTTYNKDFGDLYNADVFEVFFHTNPATPLYLEYEINQLNKELVLLVPSVNGKAYGWIPWHYEKNRVIRKMVHVMGGKKKSNASIRSWSAEIFFPYEIFSPLDRVPPVSGTLWNANFYRLDYDSGKMIKWAWGPVKHSFHELDKFRPIQFE